MDRLELIKNSAAYALMHRDVSEERISHAYLIVSPDVGFAEELTKVFLAECIFGRSDGESISHTQNQADVIRLPHGDKVVTADVEELTETVYFTPTELNKKFYVVSRAETMNEPGQNKLLKVLEEPPSSVVIILVCQNVNAMLPTVLSRVKRVDVAPMHEETLIWYLSETYGEDNRIYLAAALSGGYLGRAEEVLSENRLSEMFNLAIDTLRNMKNSKMVLSFSTRIMVHKEKLADFIDIIELVLGDCLLASTGVRDRLRFKNAVKDIIDISNEYTAEVAVKLRPVIIRAKQRLGLFGNPQSVLDELLFSMLEVKAKCRK